MPTSTAMEILAHLRDIGIDITEDELKDRLDSLRKKGFIKDVLR